MTASAHRPRTVLWTSGALLLLALFVASRVQIDADVLALLPESDEAVADFRETMDRFGGLNLLLVALEVDPAERQRSGIRPALSYADHLAREVRALESIRWLEYHRDDLRDAALDLLPWAPLFMSESDLEELLATVEDPEKLDRAVAELKASLRSPANLPFKDLRVVDPFGMVPRAADRFAQSGVEQRFDSGTGYVLDPEERFVLLLAEPTRPAADVVFGRRLLADLEAASARATETWRAEGWDGDPPRVRIGGGHAVAVYDSQLIVGDLSVGSAGALVAVITLFAVAFGRPISLVVAAVPLLAGLVFTAAFGVATLGRLDAVTGSFAALLIGLGVDFVIVLYGRYVEERRSGVDHATAVGDGLRHTASGVMLGAVTTAATFYAFLISDFKGLWRLGWLTGGGILLVMTTVFVLLPAILGSAEQRFGEKTHRIRGFGARHLFRWSLRRPKTMVALNLVLTVFLGLGALRVEYTDDALALRSTENPGGQTQTEVMRAFGLRFVPYMVRVDGVDEAEALARARRVDTAIRKLVDGEALAKVESIASWLPDPAHQEKQLERLRRFDPGTDLRQRLEEAFRRGGLSPEGFARGLDHLEKALGLERPLLPSTLAETALAPAVGRYSWLGSAGASTVIYAYPPPDRWRTEMPPGLEETIAAAGLQDHVAITGTQVVSWRLKEVVWRDARRATLLGTAVVFVFLAFDLGGIRRAVLALLPLGVGIVWMLGLMALAGIQVNFMNLFVFTMILGIGVDYGIHLVHRRREAGDQALPGTAAAIAVAALTTVCGFGSLVFSHFPGLQSMGAAAIFGTLSTAWLSVTLLPALFAWRRETSRDP
ncbi:MAG: MMPL family transporter [Thermoanaerobaculia bacterium]|nr:MMPL family transporter [Thermoanaerobaculia bacterium]